jgi:hypothetical protein
MMTELKSVPANACTFKCGELEFSDVKPETKTFPFSMKARSGAVLNHWYWGRVVHDMKGMQLRKPTCPIDYRHSEDDIIGVGQKFEANDEGLTVSGQLVALELSADDRAYEIATKAMNSVPYEASIDWRGPGIEIEELGEGASAQVNGQTVQGPIKIVRKWPLRAVAVTPYGQDSDTRTSFSESSGDEQISVFLFSSTGDSKVKLETSPAATQQHSETPAPSGVSLDTIKQFNESFGAKSGEYLAAGLTFSDAKLKFTEDRLAAAEAENKQLKEAAEKSQTQNHAATEAAKLLGEAKPVETGKGADAGGKKTFKDMFKVPGTQG